MAKPLPLSPHPPPPYARVHMLALDPARPGHDSILAPRLVGNTRPGGKDILSPGHGQYADPMWSS